MNVYAENLITYLANTRKADIPKVIQHIHDNLSVLGHTANGRSIFTFKGNDGSDEIQSAEILIPVKGEIRPSENYGKKPVFRLSHAESLLDKRVYCSELVTIDENTVVPAGVSIGKNTAVSGITEESDYPGGTLPSGGFIIKEGGLGK